jgi:hypothetical protein
MKPTIAGWANEPSRHMANVESGVPRRVVVQIRLVGGLEFGRSLNIQHRRVRRADLVLILVENLFTYPRAGRSIKAGISQ